MAQKKRLMEIINRLKKTYPKAHCSLVFNTPFQLLVAALLSAQCRDERVNQVTPSLFKKFPDPRSTAGAQLSDIEYEIRSINFFRNKAKAIHQIAKDLVEKFDGVIPQDLIALTHLRGIGRKTAHVVLGNAFGIPGIVVDTHVGRLSRRLGLTDQKDPVRVEQDLMKQIPQKDWIQYSHWLIEHGRAICTARKADCIRCCLVDLCPKIGL